VLDRRFHSPACQRQPFGDLEDNPPEESEKALLMAKHYIDARTDRAPLILLNSWNE
jgi:hypothetical protein